MVEKDLRIAGVHMVKEVIFVVTFLHVSFPSQMMLSVCLVKRKVMCFEECKREEGCDCVGWGEELNWVMKRITETC